MTEMKRESAKVYSYTLGSKSIKFIPMHHLGKQEFYDDVKEKVTAYKNEGYTVYYELISTDVKLDSLNKDLLRRKVRKIKGFSGGFDDAVKGTFMEKYVRQPAYTAMGTTSGDKRADVDYVQFINEWERLNGRIILDSVDLNTKFGDSYEKVSFYNRTQYNSIVIDYRNQYLVDMIKSSSEDKILVLYGEGHRKDFSKKLKGVNK